MKIINSRMKLALGSFKKFDDTNLNSNLSIELQNILDMGVREINDAIFFNFFMSDIDILNLEFIKEYYLDLSGYEFSVNKIHIDDYCEQNILETALLFLSEFEKKWRNEVKGFEFVAIIGFTPETEFGVDCTFTFHKKRVGETVIDLMTLEDFPNAILVVCGPMSSTEELTPKPT